MTEQLKDTSNIVETVDAVETVETVETEKAELPTLLEFTEDEILDYEEGQLDKKDTLKFLLLTPLPHAIAKFSLIGLGLIAAILWLVAALVPSFSQAMVGFYRGFVTALSAMNNFIPLSMFEVLLIVTALGYIAYFVFILVRFLQKRKTGKLLSIRYWIQFGYATLAVVMVVTMLFSCGYGLVSNRTSFHASTVSSDGTPLYDPYLLPNENEISESMIYLVDRLNTTLINANSGETQHFFFNETSGASKVNVNGNRKAKLAKAVSEAFQRAAQDFPQLKGPKLTPKAMLAGPIYNNMTLGSMYAPATGEVLYNPYFPEVSIPMLVARAIAMERGFQDEAQARLIAFFVCTRYSDVPYIQYSAYLDAYLSTGDKMARCNPHTYATVASALKPEIKREIIYFTKQLDKLYGNSNSLGFVNNGSQQTSNEDYLVLPELLTGYYREKLQPVVDATIERNCGYYVNSLIALWRQDFEYQTNVTNVINQYNQYREETTQKTETVTKDGTAPTNETPAA